MQQRHASVPTVFGDLFQIYMGKQNIIPSNINEDCFSEKQKFTMTH